MFNKAIQSWNINTDDNEAVAEVISLLGITHHKTLTFKSCDDYITSDGDCDITFGDLLKDKTIELTDWYFGSYVDEMLMILEDKLSSKHFGIMAQIIYDFLNNDLPTNLQSYYSNKFVLSGTSIVRIIQKSKRILKNADFF